MIGREEVLHIAKLAKVKLQEEEVELFQKQLSDCLDYFKKLTELDTSKVAPMKHILDVHNVMRSDEPRPSVPAGEALRNAPQRRDDLFEVPAVFER
jgi:aspartyl-tRNA(Asn)/glutamyl-tRNA(Gln) amidotransferase subunit C